MSDSKQKYFPAKPDNETGFKDPVSWLGGRELITSLKESLVYMLYGEEIDPRPWMKPNIFTEGAENDTEEAVSRAWAKKNAEYWGWKKEHFQFWNDYLRNENDWTDENRLQKEFWFDYIADTGDGQLGVYGVAGLCLSDLWLAPDNRVGFDPVNIKDPADSLLPRGAFLFIGGDTAYHVADYSSIHERFQLPFRWAFKSVRERMIKLHDATPGSEKEFLTNPKTLVPISSPDWDGTLSKAGSADKPGYWDTEPLRPIFGVPANHDYYDSLDGFNRQFRRPPFKELDEKEVDAKYANNLPLKIPTFRREQEASYTALRLPFGWWFFGIDSENEKLDFRQRAFYEQLMEGEKPKKVIIATPEPTTVFGRICDTEDKTAKYVTDITKPMGLEQPFVTGGELKIMHGKPEDEAGNSITFEPGEYCRLDLSGDVHHYARYWGPENERAGQKEHASENYASLVAGGGGAFFDSTDTLIGKSVVTKGGKKQTVKGEIPPQITFPDEPCSRDATADRIFDLSNIKKGGYIQIAGAIIAVLIFSLLQVPHIREFCRMIITPDTYRFNPDRLLIFWSIFICVLLFGVSARLLHSLNARLKEARYDSDPIEENGRVSQLRKPFWAFTIGMVSYVLCLAYLYVRYRSGVRVIENIHPFVQGVLLLLSLVAVGLAFLVGSEYLNWLPLRFKFIRKLGEASDCWISILSAEWDRKTDRFLRRKDGFQKRIWEWWTAKSVENVPVFVVNSCAVVILVTGIWLLSDRKLPEIGAELLLIGILLGGAAGLIGLGWSTGAHYQKSGKIKLWFGVLGAWHAVVQLLTPFLLLYYGPWWLIVAVLIFAVFMNGLAGTRTFLKFVFKGIESSSVWWKKTVWWLATRSFGAYIMKLNRPFILFLVWFTYGALILTLPLVLHRFYLGEETTVRKLVGNITGAYFAGFESWLPFALVLIVSAYLGYRLSRIWVSWYFAVGLAYNGHNNEAGGAARIQGFKHILRIKVEKDKLTVYVIGFNSPEVELNDLKPELVDVFELKTKFLKRDEVWASGEAKRPPKTGA